jgi:hypothetical protein
MKINKKKIQSFILILFLFSPFLVSAAGEVTSGGGGTVSLPNPLGDVKNPNIVIGNIIAAILTLVGSLALLMFVYGGLVWMTAAGNKEKVSKGKDILIWATIGMAVIFSSYAMVKFVLQGLGVSAE